MNLGAEFVRVGNGLTDFPWAIVQDKQISQARFDSEVAAQIAYRNYLLGRKGV